MKRVFAAVDAGPPACHPCAMVTISRTNWPLVILLWLAGLGAAGQYAKISVIFDRLDGIYPDAGPAVGFVVSFVGVVGIVLGVAAGVLVARIGYRRAILAGLLTGAALSGLQALFPPLPVFLGLRVAEGAAHLLLVVAIPTMIAQIATEDGRGFALMLWSTFFAVAFSLLAWFGVPLVDRYGPGALMLFHGLYLAAMAALLWPRLPHIVTQVQPFAVADLLRGHARLYSSPRLAAPALGWLAYTICFLSFLTLIPPYLPEVGRGVILGAIPLVSIAVSLTFGVWALRKLGAVAVILLGFGLSLGLSLCLIFWPGAPVLALAMGGALGLVQGATFAAVPALNDSAEDRALANGGLAQMGNLGNTIGTPLFVAVIAIAGYAGMMAVLAGIFLIGAVVHLGFDAMRRRET